MGHGGIGRNCRQPFEPKNNEDETEKNPDDDGDYFHGMMFPRSRGVRPESRGEPGFEYPTMFVTGCRQPRFLPNARLWQSEWATDIA
jgi:hypothetical protein